MPLLTPLGLDSVNLLSAGLLTASTGGPAPGLLVASVLASGRASAALTHFSLRVGDLPAQFLIALTDADASNLAVDLTGVTVQATLYTATTTSALYAVVGANPRTLTVQSATGGTVTFVPTVGDFATAGLHLLYVELLAGSAQITSSPIAIDVEPLWPV